MKAERDCFLICFVHPHGFKIRRDVEIMRSSRWEQRGGALKTRQEEPTVAKPRSKFQSAAHSSLFVCGRKNAAWIFDEVFFFPKTAPWEEKPLERRCWNIIYPKLTSISKSNFLHRPSTWQPFSVFVEPWAAGWCCDRARHHHRCPPSLELVFLKRLKKSLWGNKQTLMKQLSVAWDWFSAGSPPEELFSSVWSVCWCASMTL